MKIVNLIAGTLLGTSVVATAAFAQAGNPGVEAQSDAQKKSPQFYD